MEEREASIPVLSLGREDLLYCRPELKGQIEALTQEDVARIADKVGDALQDAYWMAVETVLDLYLGKQDVNDEDLGIEPML